MALYGYTVIAGIIIWCGMAMGTRGRAGIFVRGGGAQNAPHMYKKGPPILDWRQCGNNLALCYFAVVIELPDSLWMNCKSEFGVIFLRCSPR